jgi:hypothetical protein
MALMAETGCARRVPVDVYPIHRPSDRVKPDDKVTAVLREETAVTGTAGTDSLALETVTWRTKEVTGRLVSWKENQVSIRVTDWRPAPEALPREATFVLPIDRVEQIDRWPGFKPAPVLVGIATFVVVIGISLVLVAALSKPKADE